MQLSTTLNMLRQSFDTRKGKPLSRSQLLKAADVLREGIAQKPENTQLPWWLLRVENQLDTLDTGQVHAKPVQPTLSEAEQRSNKRFGIGALVVLVAVIGGCSVLVSGGDDDDAGSSSDADEIGASIICENFVEDRLRSPGTADFAGYGEQTITGGPTRFVVNSYVDSENGFGALLRTSYTCTVSSTDGDNWTLVDLVTSD